MLLRRHRKLPPIICIQRNVEKIVPTEKDIIRVNRNGMGNKVGVITNRVTAMMEVQSHFKPDSREYKELDYRIATGQLYQQNEIDKLKGIVAKPMPKYWYNYKACEGDKFLQSICVEKKPYFMTYVYDDYRRKLDNYIREAEIDALSQYKTDLNVLLNQINHTKKEAKFLEYYHAKYPFGDSDCAMNRICHYIENQFVACVINLKKDSKFDYTFLKTGVEYSNEHKEQLINLENEFQQINQRIKGYVNYDVNSTKEDTIESKKQLRRYIRYEARQICPDKEERTEILLDLHYHNKCNSQFFWDCVGDNIVERLEKMTYGDF